MMNSLLLRMFASFGNLQHNKPRQSQPSAAATLTSSRACAGRYVNLLERSSCEKTIYRPDGFCIFQL